MKKVEVAILAFALSLPAFARSAEELYTSRIFTPRGEFTKNIEGPAVDRENRLYVVNFREAGTIGEVATDGQVKEFFRLPEGSIGNAIRFNREGTMVVADYKKHNVFSRETNGTLKVLFHDESMHQPNDLTVALNGDLYLSDPDWKKGGGAVWHLQLKAGKWSGQLMHAKRVMGTANGIDLSPDDQTLYVSESNRREVWSYRIEGNELLDPHLVVAFKDFSLDGLRTDIDGKIYVARIEKGTIVRLNPTGDIDREIPMLGKNPTNLAFGGDDGKTVFVSQMDGRFVEKFRVERPGREWCLVHQRPMTSKGSG